MEIHAKCKYDKKAVKAFSHYTSFRKLHPKKTLIVGFIIVAVYALILMTDFSANLALILLSFLCIGIWCFIYYVAPIILYNRLCNMKDLVQTYIFNNDSLQIINDHATLKTNSLISYTLLYKVVENSEYLFLFENKQQALIVDKSTFSPAQMDQLRAVLMPILEKKYIVCTY